MKKVLLAVSLFPLITSCNVASNGNNNTIILKAIKTDIENKYNECSFIYTKEETYEIIKGTYLSIFNSTYYNDKDISNEKAYKYLVNISYIRYTETSMWQENGTFWANYQPTYSIVSYGVFY